MAVKNEGQAYDLSYLDDSGQMQMSSAGKKSKKRKKSGKIISISQGSSAKAQRRKKNPLTIISVTLLTIVVAAVAITIVQFNAELNEVNETINDRNDELAELQRDQERYQMKIDEKLTDSYIRNYAEKKLHMTPANNAQKRFISLSDGDKGEVISDETTSNVISAMMDAFSGAFL